MIPFITDTLGWRFLLAFVLSVSLWARLTLDQNPERQDIYPTEIPVEVRGLPDNLIVSNDIQPIKVRIAAPQDSWRQLQVGSFRASVDLNNATPGLEQPDVQVEVSDPNVRVLERIPSKATVRTTSACAPVMSTSPVFRTVTDPNTAGSPTICTLAGSTVMAPCQ